MISLKYLNAVAQVRFGLYLAAAYLIKGVGFKEPVTVLKQEDSTISSSLLAVVEKICTDTTVNQIDQVHASGPLMYLLRLLVRRYGMTPLMNICKKYQWVQPPNLELSTEVSTKTCCHHALCSALQKENIIDEFVIYGDKYSQIQEQVSKTVYGGMVHQLADVPKVIWSVLHFLLLSPSFRMHHMKWLYLFLLYAMFP